ncbi:MAG: acyl-CoA reductase [Crocinitomicaceae bacterium]|nr:acyl-CoA reductase [Crocinitomicaceae bacterium]|tara:strand:+ start:7769 stop:8812 length:1044 start_codon:yes stop_codon:yes gene_type:complete
MKVQDRIDAFSILGKELKTYIDQTELDSVGDKYSALNDSVEQSFYHNGWFVKDEVLRAIKGIIRFLNKEELQQWVANYSSLFDQPATKRVGVIMAGNVPLVGFHDMLCVLISGYQVSVKLSSDDKLLLPAIWRLMEEVSPELYKRVDYVDRLEGYDAVIATGSNNTSRYFESYFSKVPNIIRKNRTSVGVLTGEETEQELDLLASDIFQYYGLGCRNVSKVYVPESYDVDILFKAMLPYQYVTDNKKYMNNYLYHQTLFLMNDDSILDNGFIVLKEDNNLHSPLGVLFVERYSDVHKLGVELTKLKDQIQCYVGKDYLAFGQAQIPRLNDYADNVNTLDFLAQLKRI